MQALASVFRHGKAGSSPSLIRLDQVLACTIDECVIVGARYFSLNELEVS